MARKNLERQLRQEKLLAELANNPFLTDEELAALLKVSVPTVRLDRLSLRIPEVRERLKKIAAGAYRGKQPAWGKEAGELLALEVGKEAISLLEVTPEMLTADGLVAAPYLFAQAESLARAVVGGKLAYTDSARVRYWRSLFEPKRVLAKAVVKVTRGRSSLVSVRSLAEKEMIFKGHFIVFS